jgi:acetolactate decarboxylase
MKLYWRQIFWGVLAAVVVVVAGSGCRSTPQNTITQFSTIDALVAGAYDGQVLCGKLGDYGDFGIGTFDRLEGEMVLLDGRVYQVKADGGVYRPGPGMKTPFASVTRFVPGQRVRLESGLDFAGLQALVDQRVGNTNLPYAIQVKGRFRTVKTRSVPAQQKPYPPLVEVTKNQPTFEMGEISGTLIGFRLPAYFKGINVPGYHVHFLSDDASKGGHLLQFTLESGTVEIATCPRLMLVLPEGSGDFGQLDLSKDRSHEVEKVEK